MTERDRRARRARRARAAKRKKDIAAVYFQRLHLDPYVERFRREGVFAMMNRHERSLFRAALRRGLLDDLRKTS